MMVNGSPAKNTHVDLVFPSKHQAEAKLHLPGTRTDAEGKFELQMVPPGTVWITTRDYIDTPGGPWSNVKQREVTLSPSEKLNLGTQQAHPVGRRRL
jgi:hypothetical protein